MTECKVFRMVNWVCSLIQTSRSAIFKPDRFIRLLTLSYVQAHRRPMHGSDHYLGQPTDSTLNQQLCPQYSITKLPSPGQTNHHLLQSFKALIGGISTATWIDLISWVIDAFDWAFQYDEHSVAIQVDLSI